ncbi:hypothetical protein CHELA40_11540 [Chelatococcus asaccharovorans]|nr:hypothetical protein CHELA40_11540 [Chelatococcus asaccharovorans]
MPMPGRTVPGPLLSRFGRDQLPVGIAATYRARKGPDIGDGDNRLGAAVDDDAGGVTGRGDELRGEAHGRLGQFALEVHSEKFGTVDRDKGGLNLFAALLAFTDLAVEAFEHVLRQEALEALSIALRKGHHDHLVGHLGATEKLLRIEARFSANQSIETRRERCPRLRNALPAIRISFRVWAGVIGCAWQAHHIVAIRGPVGGLHGRIAAREGIVRGALIACALPKHRPEAPDHEHREREEDYGRYVKTVLHGYQSSRARTLASSPTVRFIATKTIVVRYRSIDMGPCARNIHRRSKQEIAGSQGCGIGTMMPCR